MEEKNVFSPDERDYRAEIFEIIRGEFTDEEIK